jgi:serine/threonine protein kinase
MAPEQTRGASVDHRADLWSVGVVLFEMVTGERPFKGDYVPAVIYSILHTEPELPRFVPGLLGDVIRKLLRKDPGERYADVASLLADLKAFQGAHPTGVVREPAAFVDVPPDAFGASVPFVRYLELKAEQKRIESEIQALQAQVLELLWETEENKVHLLGHELSVTTRKSYEYSDVVHEMQQAVRAQKKAEEREGIAVLDRHTSFVVVRKSRHDA